MDFDFIWIDFDVVVSRRIQNIQQKMLFVRPLPKRSELYFVSDEILKLRDIKVDGSEFGDSVKRRTQESHKKELSQINPKHGRASP
jgi:hypothetical protein